MKGYVEMLAAMFGWLVGLAGAGVAFCGLIGVFYPGVPVLESTAYLAAGLVVGSGGIWLFDMASEGRLPL